MSTLLSDAELLRRLVAIDSTSRRSNRPIADLIRDYLDRPGIRVAEQTAPQGATPGGEAAPPEKVNLLVTVGPEADAATRDGLTLSGHMDVVPADEPEWTTDPFAMVETEDAFFGRGTCDMKGFVALAVNVAAEMAAEAGSLKAPLSLVITRDEELGTLGAAQIAAACLAGEAPLERPLPRRTIVGEPTSLRAVRLHKGHTTARLTIRGRPAHSGYPHLGRSAIEPAGRAITALAGLRRMLEAEPCPNAEHFPEVPFVALNIGRIRGGSAVNVVPDHCVLVLGFRVLPGMESRTVAERIETALAAALDDEDATFEVLDDSPPLFLDAASDLYREVCALLGQEETVSASYATDAGWLHKAGFDCLLLGPGTIDVAHKPNEHLPKHELRRAGELVRTLARRFCR